MALLPTQTIRRLCIDHQMITPFSERSRVHGRTYGVGPASYDLRLRDTVWLWPGFGRLGVTLERLRIPDDVGVLVKSKSTNARLFINASQSTFADPGFEGWLVVEMTRHLPWPVRIKAGTPIVQLLFLRLEEPTEMPYRGQKYSNQPGIAVGAIFEDVPPVTHRVSMWAGRKLLRLSQWLRRYGDKA